MLILRSLSDVSDGEQLILMFGMGMLGSAIKANLLEAGYCPFAEIDFPWGRPEQWGQVFTSVQKKCTRGTTPPRQLSIAWSAGKSGFYGTEDDTRLEYEAFLAIVEFAKALRAVLNPAEFRFHFMSSAGGLFEGQRLVRGGSVPSPRRPYGNLKLMQEKLLQNAFDVGEAAIYRPSSVYGPMVQNPRKGLINNLVSNGLTGSVTVLDAHVMSLRDYVYSGDIGRFVGQRIRHGIAGETPLFLVSSRCISIYEVVQTVQRVLDVRLRVRFDESFGNHSNITFSDSCLPPGWAPSSLNVGVRQFMVGKHAHPPARVGR